MKIDYQSRRTYIYHVYIMSVHDVIFSLKKVKPINIGIF